MRWLAIFLIWTNTLNATVLFQSPNTSNLDYRAALKADPDLQTPTQAYLKQYPSAENRDRLLSLFADAQKAFLENSKAEAQMHFKNIVSLLSKDDWNRTEREIFLQAYFRLAQMEVDSAEQTKYLTQALNTGGDLQPQADLFPPPLIRRFEQIKNEIPRVNVQQKIFQEGWTAVLVNGAPCTRQSCSPFAQISGEARVTFISDQWTPFTTQVEISELNKVTPKRLPWINGDCNNTNFNAQSGFVNDKKAFWGLTCSAKEQINLQPVARADAIPRLDVPSESPAFYKSKWFWAGVGLAAVAIVVAGSKRNSEKEPTTTYGY